MISLEVTLHVMHRNQNEIFEYLWVFFVPVHYANFTVKVDYIKVYFDVT